MMDLIAEEIELFAFDGGRSNVVRAARDAANSAGGRLMPRLRLPLQSEGAHRMTVIQAPSGYGKSCLVDLWHRDIVQRGGAALLIRVHQQDATLAEQPSPDAAELSCSHEALIARIDHWLASHRPGTVLVDNWHRLPATVDRRILDFFAAKDPPRGQIVLATQKPLQLAQARARAFGIVRDIDADGLRFVTPEIRAFIAIRTGRQLSQDELEQIEQLSAGWPAALCVIAERIRRVGASAALELTSHAAGIMDDFFEEEIVERLSASMRDFLGRSAVIGLLSETLCNEILGVRNSGALIEKTQRAGLFVGGSDCPLGTCRFHRLFEHFLRSRLRRRAPRLHDAIALDASRWFERHGDLARAFDCAVRAEAWPNAARILESYCEPAYKNGKGKEIAAMAQALPIEVLRQHSRIAMFAARAASTRRRFGLVKDMLQVMRSSSTLNGLEAKDPEELRFLSKHIEMLEAQSEDNQKAAGALCEELLAHHQFFDHYARGTIYGSLLLARREQFNLAQAAELEEAGVREFERAESPYGMVWHLSVVGPTRALAGDLNGSIRLLEKAFAIASGLNERDWLVGIPAPSLAESYYERNDLDRSHALLETHFPTMDNGFVDQYVSGYVTMARLRFLAGDVPGANGYLARGIEVAELRGMGRLRDCLIGERVRMLLQTGRDGEALALGRGEGLTGEPGPFRPGPAANTRDEARAIAWTRLAPGDGRIDQAVQLARTWKRHMSAARVVRSSLRWDVLLTQLYLHQGLTSQAQRTLRSALALAAPLSYKRVFLDEGDAIRQLLEVQTNASPLQVNDTDRFVATLLGAGVSSFAARIRSSAAPHQEDTSDARPLTGRQTEILQLASAGASNAEIASRIGVTEGSVKWHLHQIYNRIGTRRRAGALERAQRLGFVARS